MAKVEVFKIASGIRRDVEDIVAEEVPLTIYIDAKELLTLLCSPDSLKQLCVGFLYSNGLIKSVADIKDVVINTENWISNITLKEGRIDPEFIFKRLYTSGCGRGAIFYNMFDLMHRRKIALGPKISSQKIMKLMHSFQQGSILFRQTGGVHSAALSDGENILIFKEDIGRHNAIDKAIGEALIKGLALKDLIVFTSGRISSEIVLKAEKIGSAVLVSRGAPTDQSVKLAAELNMTLVGFVRGQRMNVYTAKERLAS